MNPKLDINPSDYEIGVIVARFQVHKLHEGHIKLIDHVCENHKKVIIFLGIPQVGGTKSNPLDFASRRAMIQEKYPDIIILPHKDQRSDERWSQNLDAEILMPYGSKITALLYGSRDSFMTHYKGKFPTFELVTDVYYSGTEVRKEVSRQILGSEDFRAGVIHNAFSQWAVTYPTVDVVAYNESGQILLGKKPNEDRFRFVGGFVDRKDDNWETAAKREFSEETGGCEIGDLKYVTSAQIDDWRYNKTEHGIMTTLFIGKFVMGRIEPSDDIASLHWVNLADLNFETDVMPEHKILFIKLAEYWVANKSNFVMNKLQAENA